MLMCTVTLILTAHDHVWRVCNIKTTNKCELLCVKLLRGAQNKKGKLPVAFFKWLRPWHAINIMTTIKKWISNCQSMYIDKVMSHCKTKSRNMREPWNLCLGPKAALEHTTKSTADGQLTVLFYILSVDIWVVVMIKHTFLISLWLI